MKYKKWELSQKLEILTESEDLGIKTVAKANQICS